LLVTRLQCPTCGTEVAGAFRTGRLVNAPEPHASLLELFLRVRGNAKEMERELRVSYPTVRARLDEAFAAIKEAPPASAQGRAAGAAAPGQRGAEQRDQRGQRGRSQVRERQGAVLDALERGDITAAEAAARLRGHKPVP
jgi:hypothetical protein